jgi:carboxymethylenebutenolidase
VSHGGYPRRMPEITLTAADGHSFSGYLAEPSGTPTAGIVVIQEIFGVNSHIREDADRFAEAGYLALAPAMFDRIERNVDLGYHPDAMAAGRKIATSLQPQDIVADVLAAAEALRGRGVTKVGIVGYCFGGTVAASAACRLGETFDAAISYYGGGVSGLVDSGAVPSVPMILHFGLRDPFIPVESVDKVAETWTTSPVYRYDADHGFHCDHRDAYDKVSCDLAQERSLAFFAQHLG